ncbi:MAG: hypothetical protein AAGK47_04260 [Bacteroidota bacterium]
MRSTLLSIVMLLMLFTACEDSQTANNSTPVVKDPLPDLVSGLQAIPLGEFEAVEQATSLFDSLRKELPNSIIADTLFYPHYWTFYQQAGREAVAKALREGQPLDEVTARAKTLGFGIQPIGDTVTTIPINEQYLKANIIPYLSASFAGYTSQLIKENSLADPNAAQIGMRVMFWERFINNYPTHPLVADARARYQASLPLLLVGTPTYPFFKDKGIDSSYPVVYNQIILKAKNSALPDILIKYLDLLKKNKYKRNMTIDTFLNSYQVKQ